MLNHRHLMIADQLQRHFWMIVQQPLPDLDGLK